MNKKFKADTKQAEAMPIVHVAGEFVNGAQHCTRCGERLADEKIFEASKLVTIEGSKRFKGSTPNAVMCKPLPSAA